MLAKKILHLLNSRTFSGAEKVAITIIKNTDKVQYNSYYASLDGSIEEVLLESGIEYIPMKGMNVFELRRVINQIKPDIIHAHDFTTSIIASYSCWKIPIVSHIHNNAPWLKKRGLYSSIFLLSSFRFKKIFGVSPSILEEYVYSKLIKNKFMNIKNPIDKFEILNKSQRSNDLKTNKYDLIFLGRLSEEKNPLRFIEIVKKLVEEIPEIKVAIVGDGKLKKDCLSLIANLNLHKNIEMLGFIKNPYVLIKNSKILCITSKWEGYGLVAAEAIVLGKPVISTNVGGVPTIIDNECGFLTNNDVDYVNELKKILLDTNYYEYKRKKVILKSEVLHNIKEYTNTITSTYMNLLK